MVSIMADKKTKKDFFKELLALATSEEQKAFINHELKLLDKKHDSKKPTKAQEENIKVKENILIALTVAEKPMTISALQKESLFADLSNQKLSSLVKQLVDEGKVVRTEEKRVAYFEIIFPDESTEEEKSDEVNE